MELAKKIALVLAVIAVDRMLGLTNKLQPATKAAGTY